MTSSSSIAVSTLRHFGLVASLMGLCGGLSAVDSGSDYDWGDLPKPMEVNDVRFGMSLLPANAEITNKTNGVPTYDRSSIFDGSGRTSVLWMLPLGRLDEDGGFIAGLEASRNRYKLTGTVYQPDLDVKAYAGTVHMGMGWQLSRRTHLETTAFGGYGASSFVAGHWGSYWEYGARAGVFYTFDIGFQLGFHFSYLETRLDQNYTDWSAAANQSVSNETVVKTKGAYAGGMVGWRF